MHASYNQQGNRNEMKVEVKRGKIDREAAEIVFLGHFEDGPSLLEETAVVDQALRGEIKKAISSGEFSGKINELLLFHTRGDLPSERVLLVGLGKKKTFCLETIRQVMGTASRYVRNLGLKSFATVLLDGHRTLSPETASQAMIEGCLLGLYQFTPYRTENLSDIKKIGRIMLVVRPANKLDRSVKGAWIGQIVSEATNFARDLCNHPSNVVTPTRVSQEAKSMAKKLHLKCHVLERKDAERLGMGAFLGVARGSQEPPKFIVLEYHGRKRKGAPIVLVGKTITFDSGGISLKPSDGMEQMKTDMSGGAAVLGTIKAVAQLGLPVSLVGILPATDNMPSGTAIKPGDVLTTLSGKTVEVINTDAEGRLILADALTYASRYHPEVIIDLATLTGACVVALGRHATGILGNNPRLMDRLKQAGEECGERLWELPLWNEYFEQIKSDIADMKNVGGRGAGTITAAAFLNKFVDHTPWAHLDIAGTSRNDTPRPYIPKGSTGVGVRLLVQYLTHLSSSPGRKRAKKRSGRSRERP